MLLECGKSLWAKRRRQRAAELGLKFQAGSADAARRLLYRRFGLMGVAKYGPMYRIPFMLAGAKRARERRKREQEEKQRAEQALYAKWQKERDKQMALSIRDMAIADREQQERQYWAQHNRAQKPATTQTQQQQRAKQQQARVDAQIAKEAEERARNSSQRPRLR